MKIQVPLSFLVEWAREDPEGYRAELGYPGPAPTWEPCPKCGPNGVALWAVARVRVVLAPSDVRWGARLLLCPLCGWEGEEEWKD